MQANLKSNIIGSYRGALSKFIDAMNTHNELAKEFIAMGLTLSDGDFTEANLGITSAEFSAAYAAMVAVEDLLTANSNLHYGSIFKVKS